MIQSAPAGLAETCRSRRYQPTPPAMLASESSPAFQAFGIVVGDHPAVSVCAAQPPASPSSAGSALKSQWSSSRMRPPGPSWYHGLAAMAGAAGPRARSSAVRNVSVRRRSKRRIRLVGSAEAMSHFDLLPHDGRGHGAHHGYQQHVRPSTTMKLGKHVHERAPRGGRPLPQQPATAAGVYPQPDRSGDAEQRQQGADSRRLPQSQRDERQRERDRGEQWPSREAVAVQHRNQQRGSDDGGERGIAAQPRQAEFLVKAGYHAPEP